MIFGSLPRRYARAVLAIASEEGKLKEFGNRLAAIDLALRAVPGALEALSNRSFSLPERLKALASILDRTKSPMLLRNFLLLLLQKERISLLKEIVMEYERMSDEILNIVRVTVASPLAPNQETLASVEKVLGDHLKKTVVASGEVDPEMLGGLILKIRQTVYDGSVRRELEKMREGLIQERLN